MIRKIVVTLVLVPLAALIVLFAVANRQAVTLSFDPFSPAAPALTATLPLFMLLLVTLIAGVVIGGAAAWLKQHRWRKAARRLDAQVKALKRDAEVLRSRAAAADAPPAPTVAAIAYRPPPAA